MQAKNGKHASLFDRTTQRSQMNSQWHHFLVVDDGVLGANSLAERLPEQSEKTLKSSDTDCPINRSGALAVTVVSISPSERCEAPLLLSYTMSARDYAVTAFIFISECRRQSNKKSVSSASASLPVLV